MIIIENCVFCKIVNNELPSFTIYEDETLKVFLSIEPINEGHILIIPKEHFKDFSSIDLNTLNHINEISKKIYELLIDKLHCNGIKFVQNNGSFQDVKHYHLHLIPDSSNNKNRSLEDVYKELIN